MFNFNSKVMKRESILSFLLILLLGACEKSKFLEKTPQDQITDASYWKTAKDLELFINPFYELFTGWPSHGAGPFWLDNNSDNMIAGVYDVRLAGLRPLPETGGGWSWTNIRNINVFHANYQRVIDNVGGRNAAIDQAIGEGYFFRAFLYFDLLKRFGGVPWYDRPMTTSDQELYNPRDTRDVTANHILADLDQAIQLLKTDAGEFRVNKYIALAMKARVALYEGTWQKYHAGTEFGINNANPNTYFNQAVDACDQIMRTNTFQIEGSSVSDYVRLFNQDDLSSNREIMLWKQYMLGFNAHNGQRYLSIIGGATGLSKSLVESFLCIDGLPIAVSQLYQGDNNLNNEIKNRDPRLDAIVFKEGDAINEDFIFQKAPIHLGGEANTTSGYQIQKGALPNKSLQQTDFGSTTAAIVFRYAEVLLNFAEAKAELGNIEQTDLDKSINLLRRRVQMPDLKLNAIVADPNWDFPTLTPVINEVRRERRVELSCEGYRLTDLMRWRGHHLFVNKRPRGAKFIAADYPGFNNVNLDAQGYIDYYKSILSDGYKFNPQRDYLDPLPVNELLLNPQLIQNPGWGTN